MLRAPVFGDTLPLPIILAFWDTPVEPAKPVGESIKHIMITLVIFLFRILSLSLSVSFLMFIFTCLYLYSVPSLSLISLYLVEHSFMVVYLLVVFLTVVVFIFHCHMSIHLSALVSTHMSILSVLSILSVVFVLSVLSILFTLSTASVLFFLSNYLSCLAYLRSALSHLS